LQRGMVVQYWKHDDHLGHVRQVSRGAKQRRGSVSLHRQSQSTMEMGGWRWQDHWANFIESKE
jgi:hypothetical protein